MPRILTDQEIAAIIAKEELQALLRAGHRKHRNTRPLILTEADILARQAKTKQNTARRAIVRKEKREQALVRHTFHLDIERGKMHLRVSADEREGQMFVCVRLWARLEDGTWIAPVGINLLPQEVEPVILAIQAAKQQIDVQGQPWCGSAQNEGASQ